MVENNFIHLVRLQYIDDPERLDVDDIGTRAWQGCIKGSSRRTQESHHMVQTLGMMLYLRRHFPGQKTAPDNDHPADQSFAIPRTEDRPCRKTDEYETGQQQHAEIAQHQARYILARKVAADQQRHHQERNRGQQLGHHG